MKPLGTKRLFFLTCRLIFVFVGFYHANKFFFPEEGNATRHLIFVGINAICVFGLWKRPRWFIYFFGILMLQQFYSHGSIAIKQWQTKHIINWISVCDVLLLPLIFIALIKDKKNASQAS